MQMAVLPGLTVADDQFALPAADGGHGVDGLDPGNHGFVHALTGDDAGSFHFHGAEFGGFNRSETVDGHTEGVQNAPHDGIADRHGEDAAGTFDRIAFFNAGIFTKRATPTLSSSRLSTMPNSPPGNSRSSMDMAFCTPYTRRSRPLRKALCRFRWHRHACRSSGSAL